MTKPLMCKAIYNNLNGKIDFKSAKLGEGLTLPEIIDKDKAYGVMRPANGQYFTYKILNEDTEVTAKQAHSMVGFSFRRIGIRIPFKIKKHQPWDDYPPDFRIVFETVESDPRGELTNNTIMYHYFPINDVNHPLRGLCVVNKGFYYTSSGKPISMHKIDPIHYPEDTTATGHTIDFDQVYTHELLHGLGLPHSPNIGQMMSPNYSIMSEWLTPEEDVKRIQAKYGEREMASHWLARWINWLMHRSDD